MISAQHNAELSRVHAWADDYCKNHREIKTSVDVVVIEDGNRMLRTLAVS